MKLKEESEKVDLKPNIQKTKIMVSSPITSWQIDGKTVETVADFIFLASKITAGIGYSPTSVFLGFPCGSAGKESTCNVGDLGSIPVSEDSLKKEKATHSSILAWRIPWTVPSMGSPRVIKLKDACSLKGKL